MKKYSVKEIVKAVEGKLLQGAETLFITDLSTDSRNIHNGDLFVAIKGEAFDGHNFASLAVEKGAGALLISQQVAKIDAKIPVIMVLDTILALQKLATYHRRQYNIPVIGVTGSNGKTTTKDMVAVVLEEKFHVLKTKGNFNNELGLPLTLLGLREEHQVAVVEMGMRGLGQIDWLCQIAGINGAVITTIGETHLELLGSVENIAQAKGEILDHVPEDGFAILPADNPLAVSQMGRCKGKTETFSLNGTGDYQAVKVKMTNEGSTFTVITPQGEAEVSLPVCGEHNVGNALAAIAVGLNCGLSLEECAAGLAHLELTAMRLQVQQVGSVTIINDAYNANPESTKASLKVLNQLADQKRKIAVLGSMFELGIREKAGHYETGTAAAKVDLLVTVGDLAEEIAKGASEAGLDKQKIFSYRHSEEAVPMLKKHLLAGDFVLVKGSRGMHMERIIEALK